MALLHIEPEALRATARRLTLMAEEMDWQIQRLENVRQILQSSWQGDGRLHFDTEMNARLYALRQQSREIVSLALRLQREATCWEEIGIRF